MSQPYDSALRDIVKKAAKELKMESFLREGVYCHLSGPSYETPAESRFLRAIGCDAVGMSTAPEVVVARHCGIAVLGKRLSVSHGASLQGGSKVSGNCTPHPMLFMLTGISSCA